MANLAGQKTFLQAQQEISETVLNVTIASDATTNGTNPTLSRIKSYLNDSYREICAECDWWFMFATGNFSTVIGQQTTYAMDDLAIEIRYMTIPANQQKLGYVPFERWVLVYPGRYSNVGNTRPWAYIPGPPASNNAMQFFLFPAADQVYVVEAGFKKRVANLSGDTDIPILPPEFQDVWIAKAMHKSFVKLGDERAKYWWDYYNSRMAVMWLKNEQMQDYVNKFRSMDVENAIVPYTDINRSLFVPY